MKIGRSGDLALSAQIQSGSAQVESARVTELRVAGSTVLEAKGRLFLSQCTCFQQALIVASAGMS
jgi:hypothetical protein